MSLLDSATSFAASYNCGSYGADSFNSAAVCGATTTTLSNTGIDVLIPAGIAVVAIIVSITILLRRRSTRS